jgi:hypothetical protein
MVHGVLLARAGRQNIERASPCAFPLKSATHPQQLAAHAARGHGGACHACRIRKMAALRENL